MNKMLLHKLATCILVIYVSSLYSCATQPPQIDTIKRKIPQHEAPVTRPLDTLIGEAGNAYRFYCLELFFKGFSAYPIRVTRTGPYFKGGIDI